MLQKQTQIIPDHTKLEMTKNQVEQNQQRKGQQ